MINQIFSLLKQNADVANALATTASAIIALLAVIISSYSIYISMASLKHQRRHDILSVKPIPYITVADFEDLLRVKLRNHGSGPLIIKELYVRCNNIKKNTLVEWMPDLPNNMYWSNYSGPIKNRSVLPGSEILLIELAGKNDNDFNILRDNVRNELSHLVVEVNYTDIYDSSFPIYEKELDWFGRHKINKSLAPRKFSP